MADISRCAIFNISILLHRLPEMLGTSHEVARGQQVDFFRIWWIFLIVTRTKARSSSISSKNSSTSAERDPSSVLPRVSEANVESVAPVKIFSMFLRSACHQMVVEPGKNA